jgi:hypothetical protein
MFVALVVCVACGDDGGSSRRDGGDGDAVHDGAAVDTAIDAKPPNETQRGLVQLARVGASNGSITAGFYSTPQGATGCTWTYAGVCSLHACDMTSGLVADSAGDVTVTVDGTATTVTRNVADYTVTGQPAPLTMGSTVTMAGSGDTVPAFSSGSLAVPEALTVSGPAGGGTIDRTQTLTATWTPAPGRAYVNISQGPSNGPYPASYLRTIRCDVDAQAGTVDIAPSLLAGLEAGVNVNFTVAANASEVQDVGAWEVTTRVLALDATRMMGVQ